MILKGLISTLFFAYLFEYSPKYIVLSSKKTSLCFSVNIKGQLNKRSGVVTFLSPVFHLFPALGIASIYSLLAIAGFLHNYGSKKPIFFFPWKRFYVKV